MDEDEEEGGGIDPLDDDPPDDDGTPPAGEDEPTEQEDGTLVYADGYTIEPQSDGNFLHIDAEGNERLYDADNQEIVSQPEPKPVPVPTPAPVAQSAPADQQVYTMTDVFAAARTHRAKLVEENPLMDTEEIAFRVQEFVDHNREWVAKTANSAYDQSRSQLATDLPVVHKYYGGAVRDQKDSLTLEQKQVPRQAHFAAATQLMNDLYDLKNAQGVRMIEEVAEMIAARKAGRKPHTASRPQPQRQPTPRSQRAVTTDSAVRRDVRPVRRQSAESLVDDLVPGLDEATLQSVASARPKRR